MEDKIRVLLDVKLNDNIDIQSELNKKFEKLNIPVSSISLAPNALSTLNKELSKNKINLMLDPKSLTSSNIVNTGKAQGTKFAQAFNTSAKQSIQGNSYGNFEKNFKGVQEAKKYFADLVSVEEKAVTVLNQFDTKKASSGLQSFQVQVEHANGAIEKLKYAMNKDQGGFAYTGGSFDDKGITSQYKKVEQLSQKETLAEQKKYYDAINTSLKNEYSIKKQLLSAGQQESELLRQQIKREQEKQNYARNQLAKKGLVDSGTNSNEYATNTSKTNYNRKLDTDVASSVDTSTNKLSNFEKSWKKQGILVGDFKAKVDSLKNSLSQIATLDDKINYDEKFKSAVVEAGKLKSSVDNLNKANTLGLKKNDFSQSIDQYLRKNTAIPKDDVQEFRDLQNTISSLDSKGLADAKIRLSSLKKEMEATGKSGKSLGTLLKEDISKFTQWITASTLIMQGFRRVGEAFDFAKELDSALTNINYTMNVTASQLEKVGNSSVDMSKQLQTSSSNILGAVTLYANANETADSILEKSKPAVMLANVTGMTGAESAKTLQTIMNQFELGQDDLMSISDTIQGISQNLAHDFSKLIAA